MLRAMKIAFATAAAFGALATSALAATVTYSGTFTPMPNFDLTGPLLPQFDPTLGTLTGATYAESGSLTFTYTNLTASNLTGRVAWSVGMEMFAPGITDADHLVGSHFDQFVNAGFDSGAEGPITPGPHVITETYSFSVTPTGNLSGLIGPGTFAEDVFWGEDSDVCHDFADEENGYRYLSCSHSYPPQTARVTYTYDPAPPSVPEPASALLLLAGVAPLLRRRR